MNCAFKVSLKRSATLLVCRCATRERWE